jgi:putative glutamine amidotransferase
MSIDNNEHYETIMKKIKIGVTLDWETTDSYSKFPWYALRENYCDAISEFGALPILLPHSLDLVSDYLQEIDGLIVTGGAFDIDPALYGDPNIHESITVRKDRRTAFEMSILKKALNESKPVLGICGGAQLLAVALGGTLIQHIPDTIQTSIAHEQPNPRNEPGHTITIIEGTLLSDLAHDKIISVNSAHHQAVKELPSSLKVNALADDGVIEGIESLQHKFCLGVQWHPEFFINPTDRAIFEGLILACDSHKNESVNYK